MANETPITLVGNLTSAPEIWFAPSGNQVLNLTVASTPRRFNKQSGQWEDEDAMFLRCTLFRQMAENVAGSLDRGSRVIVTGRLKQRNYQTKQGENRSTLEVDVDDIGASLRYATATINKAHRSQPQQQPAHDPWSSPQTEEAPF